MPLGPRRDCGSSTDAPYAALLASRRQRNVESRAAFRKIYEKFVAEKVGNVYYLTGDKLLGDDDEATVDGSHPTDLGFMRQADAFQAALEPLLQKP